MSVYVILNPGQDYAAYIVEFLNQYDFKGIAVFTEEGHYYTFHHLFGHVLGDSMVDEYLTTEFPDLQALAEEILDTWREEEILGIIPWEEMTIELGAELGELLGLDWNSLEVIERFRNKYKLKSYLRHNSNARVNASRVVSTVEEALEFVERVGKWPIVIKPTEGAGSRGVFFVDKEEDLVHYGEEVFKLGQGEILLEEYVGGREYVVNGLTNGVGEVLITDVWYYDKRECNGIKNLYYETVKVDREDPVFEPLGYYAGDLIQSLGLRKCPFHMEIKIDEGGPCIIECGARFAGGNQPLLSSTLHEHSLFELAACHYIESLPFGYEDLHYDRYDRYQARIIKGVQAEELQFIQEIYGLEEAEALPSFFRFGFLCPLGTHLPKTTDIYTASYEIYLLHEDPDQIAEDAVKIRDLIRYE